MDSIGLREHSPNSEAVDLTIKKTKLKSVIHPLIEECASVCSNSSFTSTNSSESKRNRARQNRRHLNIFQKHKLKYRYLLNNRKDKIDKQKNNSEKSNRSALARERQLQWDDSGNFGSSSMTGSGNNSSFKGSAGSIYAANSRKGQSSSSNSPPTSSSSPSSGSSNSPLAHEGDEQKAGHPYLMMSNLVPLVVMMQGQIGNSMDTGATYSSFQSTTLFRCNMCDMFSNNLNDVLCHVGTHHVSIHYCFVCNRFHNSKSDYDRHKVMCKTQQQTLRQMIDDRYKNNLDKAAPLNLSTTANMAKQMLHDKKNQNCRLRKLLKCTICKKNFFGKFYLKRHLRSHTGEKLCFCDICEKGFSEYRNLKNHKLRFHNITSGSSSSVPSESSDQALATAKWANQCQQQTSENIADRSDNQQSKETTSQRQAHSDQPIILNSQTSSMRTSSVSTKIGSSPEGLSQSISVSINGSREDNSARHYDEVPLSTASSAEVGLSTMVSNQDGQDEETQKMNIGNIQLGTTSSRLEITQDNSFLEASLVPVTGTNGDKIYNCRSCCKTFRTKFAMQRHLDFHADKRPFECGQCSYKAKTKPQLKVHLMRHTGEKGYHCDKCNYACVTHSDLNRHCKSRSHMFRVALEERKRKTPSPKRVENGPHQVETLSQTKFTHSDQSHFHKP